MSVEDELEVLRLAVIRADDEHLGDVRPMEPPLLKILDFVRSHPAKQKFFEEQLVRMATGDLLSPPELVPFCMRELRWPGVLRAVRSKYDLLRSTNSHARYMTLLQPRNEGLYRLRLGGCRYVGLLPCQGACAHSSAGPG